MEKHVHRVAAVLKIVKMRILIVIDRIWPLRGKKQILNVANPWHIGQWPMAITSVINVC